MQGDDGDDDSDEEVDISFSDDNSDNDMWISVMSHVVLWLRWNLYSKWCCILTYYYVRSWDVNLPKVSKSL